MEEIVASSNLFLEEHTKPCAVLCLYFMNEPLRPAQMVIDVSKSIRSYWREGGKVRLKTLVQTKSASEIIQEQSLSGFDRERFWLIDRQLSCWDIEGNLRDGQRMLVVAEFGKRVKINHQIFHGFTIRYSINDGWEAVGEGRFGGSTLTISLCPWLLDKSGFQFIENVIQLICKFGNVCHGVWDYDYFIANFLGLYYDGSLISPNLEERERSQNGWAQVGGEERVRLCRDPREVLILGREIAAITGLDSPEGEVVWRGRHGFSDHEPTVMRTASGVVMVYCTPDPMDFNLTVRCSSRTRDLSKRVMRAMCADGVSREEYEIEHRDSLELYDGLEF